MNSQAPRLVLMLGVGRSGTSLMTGILGQLDFRIPQPEIRADESNPRGFGEPAWVVEFHQRLMRELRVTVFDARPAAWEITGRVATDPAVRSELRDWLRAQVSGSDKVAVKDPRIVWFLPLWLDSVREIGVPDASITMLRHPAEILSSARRWYGTWQTDASRAASWLNVMLETERSTRGRPRVLIGYEDVLADWRGQVERAGRVLGLPLLTGVAGDRLDAIDRFVDPALRRSRVGWDELAVPAVVRDLAEETWDALALLAQDGAGAASDGRLDALRSAYLSMYQDAESIAQSSVTAVKPRSAQKGHAGAGAARATGSSGVPAVRRWLTRRVPQRYRKRLRGMVSATRRAR
jgi:hypothetical protein